MTAFSGQPVRRSLVERAAERYDLATKPVHTPMPLDAVPVAPAVASPVRVAPSRSAEALPLGPATTAAPPSAGDVLAIDRAGLVDNGLLVPGAKVGALAEEFRLIKRQLLLTARAVRATDPAKARTLLVCSAQPDEGKTYCSVNLALSLAAERDTDVLLVDADFAKPDVMQRLGASEGPGLLDALADPAVDVERLVRRTDVPHFSLLPAGTRMVGDTELLASAATGRVIDRLLAADPRRIIVFDSPPALAASPAAVLAMLVGQVMMVVRADRTSEGDLREAVGLLDGCEHIQLVLNAIAFTPGRKRFGSYYDQETDA